MKEKKEQKHHITIPIKYDLMIEFLLFDIKLMFKMRIMFPCSFELLSKMECSGEMEYDL